MKGKNRYILDSSLLEEFKQAVSDHDDFLINTYSNYNGKNLWNLICSAKDWLSVSVNWLPYIDLSHSHDDARSDTDTLSKWLKTFWYGILSIIGIGAVLLLISMIIRG